MTGDFYFTPPVTPSPALSVREEVRNERGVLAVTSPVDGAEVFVNGRRVGEARRGRVLVIDHLRAGAYLVSARHAGYRPWEREINVALNDRVEVVIDLER
jgi:hypothetical protein